MASLNSNCIKRSASKCVILEISENVKHTIYKWNDSRLHLFPKLLIGNVYTMLEYFMSIPSTDFKPRSKQLSLVTRETPGQSIINGNRNIGSVKWPLTWRLNLWSKQSLFTLKLQKFAMDLWDLIIYIASFKRNYHPYTEGNAV